MSNNVLYFSHDANAKRSPEIMRIRMKHGDVGYAIYFYILEDMRYAKDFMLATDYEALAFDNHVDSKILQSVVEDFGLFEKTEDGQYFYSESFLRRMKKVSSYSEKRSAAGRKGAAARWGDRAKKDEEQDAKEDDEDDKIMANAYGKMANASLSSIDADSKMANNALNKKKENKTKLKEKDTTTDANASEGTSVDQLIMDQVEQVEEKPKKKPTLKAWERRAKKSEGFQQFVSEYPEHRSLGGYRAFLAWERQGIDGDPELLEKTMKWLRSWIASDDWTKDGGKYVPNMDKFMNEYWERKPAIYGGRNQGHTIASSVAAMNIDQSNRPEITIESSKADWARYQKEKEERRIAAQKWRAEQEAKKQEAANVK